MSASTWTMYDPDTGLGVGPVFTGPHWMVAGNTPAGAAAYPGEFDATRQRVRLVTDDMGDQQPVLTEWVPPSPAADEWQTWRWDEGAWRWLPVPTLARLKADAIANVQAAIDLHEAQQARPQRDVLTALVAGQTPPAEAVVRLQEIEAAIVPLRARRAALEAAITVDELNAT